MENKPTPLESGLILSYIYSNQLVKCLEAVLLEMKAHNDPRAGKFQSLLEKLLGASKRAFSNVEKNIQDKEMLEEDMWDLIGANWEQVDNSNITKDL